MDEDAAERKDAAHDDSGNGARVEGLLGNLSRDLIGSHWMLNRLEIKLTVNVSEKRM